ncbi:hypothetical protein AB0L06_29365 [Spirillospora sp. NPDC052269]
MDLTFLKPLYAGSGPFSSLYLDLTRTTEDAAKAAELRWRARRGELAAQGAPDGDLRALEAVVAEDLRDRRAVAGLPATAEAAFGGRVESLLLDEDPAAPTRLWVGPRPHEIAATPERLRELGVAEPAEDRADAALIRAVAATDGDLTIIPAITPQAELGVGAVLRY